jgi:UDP-2,3-diacylglucosamine hydrolase
VAHRGETDPRLESVARCVTWVRVGQLGKTLSTLKRSGVKEVTFAGGITRVSLFGGVRLDLKAIALIARTGSVKDDVILRAIAGEFEREGIRVIAAHRFLNKSVPTEGPLTTRTLSPEERSDAAIGWEAALAIGRLDIGQTVVVTGGVVTAVEAVEGTDRAIRRAGELAGRGGVVVKLPKPQQDRRLDLPAVGPGTIDTMIAAGATALVVESRGAVFIDPQGVISRAERAGIAVAAFDSLESLSQAAVANLVPYR